MTSTPRVVANADVVLREETDDWAVLFHPDTAAALGVSPVGVAIWRRLDGRRGISDLAEALGEEFDEIPDTVEEEVAEFLDRLVEFGFAGHVAEEG